MEAKRLSSQSGAGDNQGKRLKRREILENKASVANLIGAAYADRDPLSAFPHFRHFSKNGLSVSLESDRGSLLSPSVKQYIQNLLKANMEAPYGSEWPEEEKVKRWEMVSPEALYVFVHEAARDNANGDVKKKNAGQRGIMVGFVHYRFLVEEDLPVLYVYELQLQQCAQGKGLGKFLMQLVELIACKNRMKAVMLTVQKANVSAMNFYTHTMRYVVSAISPSRVDPVLLAGKSYEILCKAFNPKSKAVLEDRGAAVALSPLIPAVAKEVNFSIPDVSVVSSVIELSFKLLICSSIWSN